MKKTQQFRLFVLFIQALIATLWSLYFGWFGDPVINSQTGEWMLRSNGFSPCELCRYARILIYPIALLSFVALIKKQVSIAYYIIRLALWAIILESYHYFLQKTIIWTGFTCTLANPCDALTINYFGFITIPLLCLFAAIIIFFVCLILIKSKQADPSLKLFNKHEQDEIDITLHQQEIEQHQKEVQAHQQQIQQRALEVQHHQQQIQQKSLEVQHKQQIIQQRQQQSQSES